MWYSLLQAKNADEARGWIEAWRKAPKGPQQPGSAAKSGKPAKSADSNGAGGGGGIWGFGKVSSGRGHALSAVQHTAGRWSWSTLLIAPYRSISCRLSCRKAALRTLAYHSVIGSLW